MSHWITAINVLYENRIFQPSIGKVKTEKNKQKPKKQTNKKTAFHWGQQSTLESALKNK